MSIKDTRPAHRELVARAAALATIECMKPGLSTCLLSDGFKLVPKASK
jgi:hypothetical protein